jgi:branched-subunit amino acid aminotransferase/4-amino-4-deoxychorismate lyase
MIPRRACIDGRLCDLSDAALPVTDEGVARGYGGFETVGVWDGTPFRLPEHLERLHDSLVRILLPPPPVAALQDDVARVLDGVTGDAALRLYVTGSGTRIVTLDAQPAWANEAHLVPQIAPWIRPTAEYGPAGAKTMSYLPNMVASKAAQAAGGDDALLISSEGNVLEGPTFAMYWVTQGVIHAPAVELGIIDSISRRTVLALARDAGYQVVEGVFTLDDLAAADEAMLSSAVRDVVAVRRVGDAVFEGPMPVRDALSAGLEAARRDAGPATKRDGPV